MKTQHLSLLFLMFVLSCTSEKNIEKEILEDFKSYYVAVQEKSDDKWNFTTDTLRMWFDDTTGNAILQIKGRPSTGPWREWDKVMQTQSRYDSIWYEASEHAVKGYFFENNDFYTLIGKGPTKTLRTYWLNEDNKIDKLLMYWIPQENTTTSEHLGPIVEWAMQHDSNEIKELYPDGRIVPSEENAKRWKKLLNRYNDDIRRQQ